MFELNEAGAVILKESLKVSVENGNKVFAETDAAKAMLEFAKGVAEKYYELGIDKMHPGKPIGEIVSTVFESTNGVSRIKVSGVSNYNSNPYFKKATAV
ncbi:hypothetical protein [Paraflavitalea speifideaquila]|uniref:hypothetical protein n=1 Tax=Paraflavitalea speifideaquila TaxID=3076558 RepID=UPI0028E3134B|nr:hypothetical protein [Paraflavitalea speifideiaquila]